MSTVASDISKIFNSTIKQEPFCKPSNVLAGEQATPSLAAGEATPSLVTESLHPAENMSPIKLEELDKEASLILSLVAQILGLTSPHSTPDIGRGLVIYTDKAAKNKSVGLTAHQEKMPASTSIESTVASTDQKEDDENSKIVSAIHAVLATTSESPTHVEQSASVDKLQKLFFTAKNMTELKKIIIADQSLLIQSIRRGNLLALIWLFNIGAKFPIEYDLMLTLSAPDVYGMFKKLIESRRKNNVNFIAVYEQRYTELLALHQEKNVQQEKTRKEDLTTFISEIDKNVAMLTDNVFKRILLLVREKCGEEAVLSTFKLTPSKFQEIMKEICSLSIVETQGAFASLQAGCANPPLWLIYSYHLHKARKEANKFQVQMKLKSFPTPIQTDVSRLLKTEQACFDTIFKKLKKYLDHHYAEEVQIFEHFFKPELLKGMIDPIAGKKILLEINQRCQEQFENNIVPKIKNEIVALFNKTFANYPEQLASPNLALMGIEQLFNTLKEKYSSFDKTSLQYFFAVQSARKALTDLTTSIKFIYQAIQDALLKFEPTKDELGKVREAAKQASFMPIIFSTGPFPKQAAGEKTEALTYDKLLAHYPA